MHFPRSLSENQECASNFHMHRVTATSISSLSYAKYQVHTHMHLVLSKNFAASFCINGLIFAFSITTAVAIDWLSAGYQLAISWYRLSLTWPWTGYGLAMGWLWDGYGMAIGYLSVGYGLAMADYGWL